MLTKIKNKLESYYVFIIQYIRLCRYFKLKNVIIILIPSENTVNGGIMSLVKLWEEYKSLTYIHASKVFLVNSSYNPSVSFTHYNRFKNNSSIFNIKLILSKLNSCKELSIHIPECLIKNFKNEYQNSWSDKHKKIFQNIEFKSVNILNQNHLLMPKLEDVNWLKELFNNNITMTFAHKKSIEYYKNTNYNFPLHYMSAWVNQEPYKRNDYSKKENIILISPDNIERNGDSTIITKNEIVEKLKKQLIEFDIVIIQNLSYEQYKGLVLRSKFVITFGEGLDGYFIENALMGGISFAVYNSTFFTSEYKKLKTVYGSFEDLYSNIVSDINKFNQETIYNLENKNLYDIVAIEYTYERYQERVKNYFLKKYSV